MVAALEVELGRPLDVAQALEVDGGRVVLLALQVDLDRVADERHRKRHVDPARVAQAEGREARAEGNGDALGPGREAAPAADPDQQHLRERDRGQREVWALQAIGQNADDQPSADRQHDPDEQAEPGPAAEAGHHQRRRVGADAEERGVPDRDLTGVAAGDVPGGGERAPQEDQHEAVEEVCVAHDERREGGEPEDDDGAAASAKEGAHAQTPRVSAPR